MTCDARYVLFLNPDTEIVDGTFGELVAALDARPDVGLAGVSQLTADGELWPTIRYFPSVRARARRGAGLRALAARRGRWPASASSTSRGTSARSSATGPRARSCSRAARRC